MIPAGATFRRAEGLWISVAPCAPEEVTIVARRQDGDVRGAFERAQLRLLSRMDAWRTADELGVAPEELAALVDAHVAFWSRGRPSQVLTGAPTGGDALRGNVLARPLLSRGGQLDVFPYMPKLGELDDAVLAGMRFEPVEWETAVATIQLACCRAHAQRLRDVVAGAPDPELRALLDELGLLEAYAPPAWDGAPRVTWLGHAGVLYEACERRIAIDPPGIARSEPTRHGVRPYDLRELGALDAVLITHGDADHLDPTALARVPRTTPIVIPRAAAPRPYHVDMHRMLALLGFERVIALDPWESVRFADVTVTAAPFVGEDWSLGDLPCRTYVVSDDHFTIYANADSLTDDATADRLASIEIDVAFLGVGGSAEAHAMPPGFGYGHFYTPWIPAARHAEWIQMCNGPREAAALARRLGARHAFGYAAGGHPAYSLAYSDRGTNVELAELLGDRAVTLAIGVPFSPTRDRSTPPASDP